LLRPITSAIGFDCRPTIEASLSLESLPVKTCVKESIGFDRALSISTLNRALRLRPMLALHQAHDLGLRDTQRSSRTSIVFYSVWVALKTDYGGGNAIKPVITEASANPFSIFHAVG